jgi:hypothetical protein
MSQDFVFSRNISRGLNAVAAGTSDQSATVDMRGYESAVAVALFGTLTSGHQTKLVAKVGNQSDGSDAVALAGAETALMGDTDSNKMLILEVDSIPSGYRYLTFTVDRGTANAVIDGMVIMRETKKMPETQGSTVSKSHIAYGANVSSSSLSVSTGTTAGTTWSSTRRTS